MILSRKAPMEGNCLTVLHGIIDSTLMVMGESINNNFSRWPNSFVGETYSEEEWFLRNWIDERLEFLDGKRVVSAGLSQTRPKSFV